MSDAPQELSSLPADPTRTGNTIHNRRLMATSLKKQRVIDAAGVLADAMVASGLKPSELLDVGEALDRQQEVHRSRAEALVAIATMLRADAVLETRLTAGASWNFDEEDSAT